jgi:hypothetical protein
MVTLAVPRLPNLLKKKTINLLYTVNEFLFEVRSLYILLHINLVKSVYLYFGDWVMINQIFI